MAFVELFLLLSACSSPDPDSNIHFTEHSLFLQTVYCLVFSMTVFTKHCWKLCSNPHIRRRVLIAYLQRHLQSVLNAAARLLFQLRRYDHITDALAVLHWLQVPQRVDYKVAVMAFGALDGLSPPYLDQLVCVSALPGRHRLRSSSSHQLQFPAYCVATVGQRPSNGTACLLIFSHPPTWRISATN